MNRTLRAGFAALAFTGLVAQPMAANATVTLRCPPLSSGYDAGPLPMLFVTGFFICAGLELGRQDVNAHGKPVTGRERVHALLGCLLLPFPHKHHNA